MNLRIDGDAVFHGSSQLTPVKESTPVVIIYRNGGFPFYVQKFYQLFSCSHTAPTPPD
jgi:hypothetical protein